MTPILIEHQLGIGDLLGCAHERHLDCSGLTMEEAQRIGELLAIIQRGIQFWCGDLARYSEHKWPETHHQVWPEWISPGLLSRTAGVCRAYPHPPEDRMHDCSYSQYLDVAGKPDRQALLAEIVEKGQTTDESRAAKKAEAKNAPEGPRWLLAVDCNYFLHRFWHSGAGVEAASQVARWIRRTADRLKNDKGLTDVACCFDSHINHRKELTKDWEDRYKDRPMKDPELAQQLNLVRDLLEKDGFAAISVEGQEADDVMASFAKQFPGKVTLLTQDKDQRQCLSATCNILLDVEWKLDEHSGENMPEYKWLSAKAHTEATGIPPEKWCDYQTIMGDNVDGIRGIEGIGQKGAADLIQQFGTVEAVIAAAKANDETIKPKKREAIIAFEPKLEVTRKLVCLRDDLKVPESTRLT